MSTINQSSPPEIIDKVMCGDAVKSAHPFFESTVVGIHVLHVVDLAGNPDTCSQIDWAVDDADFPYCWAPNALPLSVQRTASFASNGLSAAPMCSLSAFSKTKSDVFPVQYGHGKSTRESVQRTNHASMLCRHAYVAGASYRVSYL